MARLFTRGARYEFESSARLRSTSLTPASPPHPTRLAGNRALSSGCERRPRAKRPAPPLPTI